MKNKNNQLFLEDLPEDFELDNEYLAIDTESMGLNPSRDRLCLIQLSSGNNSSAIIQFKQDSDYSAPRLKKVLSDPNIIKIFHFARADLGMIKEYLNVWAEPCYCTKVASRLARTYTDHHSLRELCYVLLGVKISKTQQCSDWGAESITPEQIEYAASDVLYLHQLRKRLDSMLKREKRLELAYGCFAFLKYRVELDLLGWSDGFLAHHM